MSNEINLVIVAALVFCCLSIFIASFIIIYQRKQIGFKKKAEEMQSSFQNELLKTRLEIQEETFRNISQEIHDNIGQALSFIKLNLNTVDGRLPDDVRDKLIESKNLLSKSIQDLRDIARSLSPDFMNEIGLTGAIQQQLQLLEKTGEYKTSLSIDGDVYKNEQQRELVVYRIVQELLNNIMKHADASEVNINMQYHTDKLIISVTDNGKGFDTELLKAEENNTGLGLRNMLNRMTLISGFITISSKPGTGTTAIIELPRAPNNSINAEET